MTTIVKHRKTGNEYILLGINGEANKANPSRFISELFAQEKAEVSCSATVCDVRGNIFLAYIDDLIVTEIDGKKPADILPEPTYDETRDVEYAPNDAFSPPVNNNVNPQTDFEDDEELEDEDFEGDRDTSSEPQTSFVYGQGSSAQSNVNDDDDDWI